MKTIYFLSLIFSCLMFTSCDEVDEENNSKGLSFRIIGQGIVLPDTPTTTTCYGEDISGTRFSWSGIEITWADPYRDLRLVYLKIVINESNLGGEFTKVISDEVLGNILQYNTTNGPESIGSGMVPGPVLPAANAKLVPQTISLNPRCRVHITGLNLSNPDENFTATAKLTLFGLAVGNKVGEDNKVVAEGEESPVRAIGSAKVLYNLN